VSTFHRLKARKMKHMVSRFLHPHFRHISESDLIFSSLSSPKPDVALVGNGKDGVIVLHGLSCDFSQAQATHPRYHLLLAIDGCSQKAAKWPQSVCTGLTPCLVYMPGPCHPLPLQLHLPSQDPGRLLPAVRQGFFCQVSPAHTGYWACQRQPLPPRLQ